MKRTLHHAATLVLCSASLLTIGCETQRVPVGPQALGGDWSLGLLGVNLEPSVTVLAVVAAAENALTRAGYSIGQRTATARDGRVVGTSPSGTGSGSASVYVVRTAESTRIEVAHLPGGNLGASRDLMDAVLGQLQTAPN
jgi:hypothetical protein